MQYITDKTMVNGKTCVQFKPRSSQTAYIRFVEGTGYKSCSVFLKNVFYINACIVSNHDSIQEYREFLQIKRSKDANGIIIMFINFHFSTFMQMSHKHRICRKGKGLDSVRWLLLKGKSNARTSAYSWILARAESIRQGQLRQNTYGQCPIRSNIVYY